MWLLCGVTVANWISESWLMRLWLLCGITAVNWIINVSWLLGEFNFTELLTELVAAALFSRQLLAEFGDITLLMLDSIVHVEHILLKGADVLISSLDLTNKHFVV